MNDYDDGFCLLIRVIPIVSDSRLFFVKAGLSLYTLESSHKYFKYTVRTRTIYSVRTVHFV